MFQWDDLRFFFVAAKTGSFSAAAEELGADVATVSRRIARLETALNATLVSRSRKGIKLTSQGRQLMMDGEPMESIALALQDINRESAVSGTIRLSAPEGIGVSVLAPGLVDFCNTYPDLNIQLAANPGYLSATTREVDISITLAAPTDNRLFVEPLAHYSLGLYAARSYLDNHDPVTRLADLKSHRIIGYVGDQIYAPELRYLDEILPGLTGNLSSTSIHAQRNMIESGAGIGVLPRFLGDGLVPVLVDQVVLRRRFWISIHKDMANIQRIRLLREWLKASTADLV